MARIYILQNGDMWNCGKAEYVTELEAGDYVIYLISAEGRSDELYLAQTLLALGYPLGALASYFFEEPEEEDLSRLISSGGGLALHDDGKLKVAGADIIAPGGGIALDESHKLRAAPSDIIASGGGLAVSEGKMRIEVSGMSQAERESLALALGVLPRLAADLNIYVDPSGSDVLDAGRGLSADKPFKSVQTAVNWVSSRYDLGFYNAIFHLAAGVHAAGAVVSGFAASGGGVIFQGADTGQGDLASIIRAYDNFCVWLYGKNSVTFKDIKFESHISAACSVFRSQLPITGGDVILDRFEAEIHLANDVPANKCARFARVADARLLIRNTGAAPSKISVLNYIQTSAADCVFDIQPNGVLEFGSGSSAAVAKLIFTGKSRECLMLNGGVFRRAEIGGNPITPQGVNYSARRYSLANGSLCVTHGAGPEFFPGDAAGCCDAASSYS